MKKNIFINNKSLRIFYANNFFSRLRGLLGTSFLPENEGLLLKPCNSVHMIGMRYAIDVVYLDKENCIIKIVENLRPWSGFSICFKAESVLEMAVGMAKEYNMCVGQKIDVL